QFKGDALSVIRNLHVNQTPVGRTRPCLDCPDSFDRIIGPNQIGRGGAVMRSKGFAHVGLTSVRWLLPWIAVLLVSVSLAYASGIAMRAGVPASDQWEVQATPLAGDATGALDLEQSTTPLSEPAMEPSRSTFAVMSMTSPASTGAASPSGCCTWN